MARSSLRVLSSAVVLLLLVSTSWCASYLLLPVGSSQVGEFVSATDQVVFKTHLDPFTDALYLRYTLSSVKLGACLWVSNDEYVTPLNSTAHTCTGPDSPQNQKGVVVTLDVSLQHNSARIWYAMLTASGSYPNEFSITASASRARPYEWRGYCFYLTTPGSTCDASCSSIGGANLIESALFVFDSGERCTSVCPDEPISYFQQHDNTYQFADSSLNSAYRTAGYGYVGSYFVCHCATTNRYLGGGALLNDYNSHRDRALACPCFRSGAATP